MKKKLIIKNLIATQHATVRKKLMRRSLQLPLNTGKIIVVTGVRRCGKTSLLWLTLDRIIQNGIPIEKTCFLNFDDERLLLESNEFDYIFQAYKELYPAIELSDCHFFFDEIQNIGNWERFIRRVYDSISENIYISGSNSKRLGSEIATSLRGRTIRYELFPLMFDEYLQFRQIESYYFSDQKRAEIIAAFYKYLEYGGFPEIVTREHEQSFMIISDYFQVLLFRDIVERYNVTKISVLKYFIRRLIAGLCKPFSINKIFNELKSKGIAVDKNFLYNLIEYIEAVYMVFRLYKFDYSVVNREMSDKKLYCIDNGLLNTISFQFSKEWGKLLENNTSVWLKSRYKDNIFYFSNKHECDFILFDRDKPEACIQVSYDISDADTAKREIMGLLNAMKYFNIKTGLIFTAEQETQIETATGIIPVKPVYKIMIDNKFC